MTRSLAAAVGCALALAPLSACQTRGGGTFDPSSLVAFETTVQATLQASCSIIVPLSSIAEIVTAATGTGAAGAVTAQAIVAAICPDGKVAMSRRILRRGVARLGGAATPSGGTVILDVAGKIVVVPYTRAVR